MKKRILSLVLAFVMVFAMAIPTFAEEGAVSTDVTAISTEAAALKALGLLTGSGSGVTPEYLAGEMNRFTAALMVVKMLGKEAEALKYVGTENFPDAKDVEWTEGRNVLAYLKATPAIGFAGTGTGNFAPNTVITQESVLKVVLTALGYTQGVDFEWAGVNAFATEKGLTVVEGAYTVDALAKNVYSALKTVHKTTGKTLAQDLVAQKVIDAELAASLGLLPEDVVDLKAVSAEFINLKQVKVVFNKTVDKDDAKDVTKYTVNDLKNVKDGTKNVQGVVSAKVQEDGKSVVLTLGLNNDSTPVKYVVKNGSTDNRVKVTLGEEVEFEKLKVMDSTFPKVESVKLTGPKEVEVAFSEPVEMTGNPFSLKAGAKNIGVQAPKMSSDFKTATIGLLAEVKDGEHTFTVAGTDTKKAADFAGYMIAAQDIKFEAVKDTAVATVEFVDVSTDATKEAEKTEITVKFSKAMKENSKHEIVNLEVRSGYNSEAAGKNVKTVAGDNSNEYVVTVPGILAPGTHTLYFVGGTTASTKVKDTWGVVFEDSSLEFTVSLDNEKPTVTSIVTEDENKLVVTFSEKVAGARFVVKDAKGNKVSFSAPVWDGKKATLSLTKSTGDANFKGGEYTVEVKDAEDLSIYKNKMDAVTITVSTEDKIVPKIEAAATTDTALKVVRVVFSEEMDAAVGDKANWGLVDKDGKGIANEVKKAEISDDAKSVVVTFANPVATDAQMQVVNAKDLAGNKVADTLVALGAIKAMTSIVPDTITLSGENEITVEYTGIIEDIVDGVFEVKTAGTTRTIDSLDVSVDGGDTTVIIGLLPETVVVGDETKDKTGATTIDSIKTISVQVVATGDNVPMNQYEALLSNEIFLGTKVGDIDFTVDGTTVTVEFADACAPIMTGLKPMIAGNKIIEVEFTEEIYQASVQDADFEVAGCTIEKVFAVGNTVQITLHKDDIFVLGAEMTVKLVGEVQDIEKNATTETKELEGPVVAK